MGAQSPNVSKTQLLFLFDGHPAGDFALDPPGKVFNQSILNDPNLQYQEKFRFNMNVFSNTTLEPTSSGLHNLTVISTEQELFDYVSYTYVFLASLVV